VLGLGAGLGGVHNDLSIGTEKKFAGMIDSLIGSHLIYPASFFKDPCELTSGLGIGIGVGREVSKNWIVGIDVFWGRAKSDSNIFGSNLFGFGAHVSHLFY